jgi:hypothetical protein
MEKFKIKYLILCIVVACNSYGCRKKKELDLEYVGKPLHCYNKLRDEDETGVDEGGSCGGAASFSFASACGEPTNSVTIDWTSDSVSGCVKTIDGNRFVYTIGLDGGGFIKISTSNNVVFNSLLAYANGSLDSLEYEGYIRFPSSSFTTVFDDGNVKIKAEGPDVALEICNSEVYGKTISAYAIVN